MTVTPAPRKWRSLRRPLLAVLMATALAAAAAYFLPSAQAQTTGFHVVASDLVDANGKPFLMRGSTHPHEWYQGEGQSIADMSALGANTVRVVLGSGQQWGPTPAGQVQTIIDECKANRVVCVLEVHDTTGYADSEAPDAASLDEAVDYWESIQDVLHGEEAYVLINIGNEPWGNENVEGWEPAMIDAVERMRGIGFQHTLIVDAPNWGQDWTNTMRDGVAAENIFDADPQSNVVFSVHMYGVYDSHSIVVDYYSAFLTKGLPLIVGEFGDGTPTAIEEEAHSYGIGWIAWSWSGNTGGTHDQVLDFDPDQLTSWGERVFNGPWGIGSTAERASVFDDIDPTTPTDLPTLCDQVYNPPTGLTVTAVTSTSVTLEWDEYDDFPGAVMQIDRDGEPVGTTSSTTFTDTGLTPGTTYEYEVGVKPETGCPILVAAEVTVTTIDATPGDCTAELDIVNDWGSGWQGTVSVTAGDPVDGWIVGWAWPGGQAIQSYWNADLSSSGSTVTAGDVGWNATIAAGETREVFGFIASGPAVALDDLSCAA